MRYQLLIITLFAAAAQAEVYRCVDERGRPSFSDRPCAADAETVELDVPAPAGVDLGGTGDFSDITKANKERSLDRRIATMEGRIADLKTEHDARLKELDAEYDRLGSGEYDTEQKAKLRDAMRAERDRYRRERSSAVRSLTDMKYERAAIR